MIDGMISQLGDSVVKLWQKDDGGTGKYPPPTLHVSNMNEAASFMQWFKAVGNNWESVDSSAALGKKPPG